MSEGRGRAEGHTGSENTAEPRTQHGELPGPGHPSSSSNSERSDHGAGVTIAPKVLTAVGQQLCALSGLDASHSHLPDESLHLRSSAAPGAITWLAGTPCGQQWDCGIPHQVA